MGSQFNRTHAGARGRGGGVKLTILKMLVHIFSVEGKDTAFIKSPVFLPVQYKVKSATWPAACHTKSNDVIPYIEQKNK